MLIFFKVLVFCFSVFGLKLLEFVFGLLFLDCGGVEDLGLEVVWCCGGGLFVVVIFDFEKEDEVVVIVEIKLIVYFWVMRMRFRVVLD